MNRAHKYEIFWGEGGEEGDNIVCSEWFGCLNFFTFKLYQEELITFL